LRRGKNLQPSEAQRGRRKGIAYAVYRENIAWEEETIDTDRGERIEGDVFG